MSDTLTKIARENLRANLSLDTCIAWDVFWGLPGMLVIGEYDKAREFIRLFATHQKTDGKIPRTFAHGKPLYRGSCTAELLLLTATAKYLDATRDYDFVDEYFQYFHKAMMWQVERTEKKLIHQNFLERLVGRSPHQQSELLTNVLYVLALQAMVTIAQVAGRDEDGAYWATRAHSTKRAVREHFYLENSEKEKKEKDLLGNIMAVLADVAPESVTRDIVRITKNMQAESHAALAGSDALIGPLAVRMLMECRQFTDGQNMLAHLESMTLSTSANGVLLETLVAVGLAENDVHYQKPEPRIC